jgi:predicted nucleotidyltransferase
MNQMHDFNKYQSEIDRICRKHDVKSLAVFGSFLADQYNDESDIDLLLELKTAQGGIMKYMGLKFELERLFSRSVDLVMPEALTNQRLQNYIFANVSIIYEA